MKSVIIFSGGLDSTVLLYQLRAARHTVYALSVDYGQRHRRELTYARATCESLGIEHVETDLRGLSPILQGSSLTDPSMSMPQGHYEEANMRLTVVPNRNMLLLSLATAWAVSLKADGVAYAAHGGDHAVYPDCREAFADAMAKAISLADWHEVALLRPFVGMTKSGIVERGRELGVPFERTWSCYEGGERHCGRCGTCVERREAFHLAAVDDPTEYDRSAPSVSEMMKNNWRLPS